MAKILKQAAEKLPADVPAEKVFWCCDGRSLRNIRELGEAFAEMTDDTFAFHATSSKNDFTNWVSDAIQDWNLAKGLAKSQNRTQAASRVAEHLVFLQARLVSKCTM
jgi:hypothetical protein